MILDYLCICPRQFPRLSSCQSINVPYCTIEQHRQNGTYMYRRIYRVYQRMGKFSSGHATQIMRFKTHHEEIVGGWLLGFFYHNFLYKSICTSWVEDHDIDVSRIHVEVKLVSFAMHCDDTETLSGRNCSKITICCVSFLCQQQILLHEAEMPCRILGDGLIRYTVEFCI